MISCNASDVGLIDKYFYAIKSDKALTIRNLALSELCCGFAM